MASRTIAMLLVAAFVVSFAPPATAQQPKDFRRCLSSIRSVIGCPVEIARALFNPQGSVIGPSCCAVIDGCILLVFPSVGAQSIIKSICALGGAPSPTPERERESRIRPAPERPRNRSRPEPSSSPRRRRGRRRTDHQLRRLGARLTSASRNPPLRNCPWQVDDTYTLILCIFVASTPSEQKVN